MTEPTETTPYAQAAELYWRAGWHGVLPLPPRRKKNPPSGYTGAAGRYPSYPDVATWIDDRDGRYGNIALRMPPNVIGLDVDDYGDKGGGRTFTLAESMHGQLPPTWRTTSRDDGVSGIRLYRVPEGLAWPGELGPGTEIIQRNHRYAVVWPSIHPDTDRTYRWIDPDGVTSTHIPDPDTLPFLPETWVTAYTGGVEAVAVPRNQVKYDDALAWIASRPHATTEPCSRMQRVIDGAAVDIGNGSAHNPARDYTLRIVRLTEEQHRGGIAALGAARTAFITEATDPNRVLLGKTRRSNEEAAYEWSELVASAVGLVTANPTGMDTCDCDGGLTDAIVDSAASPEHTPDTDTPEAETASTIREDEATSLLRNRLRDGEDFILNIPDTIPTIWGDNDDALWVEGEALMIAGPPGVGKTTVTGQVLRGLLGLQSTVLELPIKPAEKILYLAMDRPAQIRRALGRTFDRSEADVLREKIEFWEGPPPGDFAKHPEVLTTLAQLAGATHVIIDSLKDAAVGLSEDDIGAAYNRARQKALAAGVQILELHHMVKRGAGGAKPTELADVYGSAWLTAGAGSVVLLWGAAGDPIVELRHLKQPVGEVGPWRLQHDHTAGRTTVFHGTDIMMILAGAGTTGATAKTIACQMFETDKPTAAQREKARRKLERLADQGHAERIEDPLAGAKQAAKYRAAALHGNLHDPSRLGSPKSTHEREGREGGREALTSGNADSVNPREGVRDTPFTISSPPKGDETGSSGAERATAGFDFLACNGCGEEYLAQAIELGQGYCDDCNKTRRQR